MGNHSPSSRIVSYRECQSPELISPAISNGIPKHAYSLMRIFNLQPMPVSKKVHNLINKSYNGKVNLLREHLKKPFRLKRKPNIVMCKYAYYSKAGFTPYNLHKTNQDAYICCPNIASFPYTHLFAVTDGHGQYGKAITDLIKTMLPCTCLNSYIRK